MLPLVVSKPCPMAIALLQHFSVGCMMFEIVLPGA
jgi:hypothetical protein